MDDTESETDVLQIVESDGIESDSILEVAVEEEKKSKKKTEDDDTDDENDEFYINWDETLYLPEPCLITEETFNKHFSFSKYYSLLKNANIVKHVAATAASQKKKSTTKVAKDDNKSLDNAPAPVLPVIPYDTHTKYHLMSVQPKLSNIKSQDRSFYSWFLKNNNNRKIAEQNELRFKELLQCINKERGEYQQFLQSCFFAHPNEYLYLNMNVRDFVMCKMSKSTQLLLQSTKRFFALKQTIDISRPPAPSQVTIEFKFLKCVKQQVNIPIVKEFPLHTSLKPPKMWNSPPISESEEMINAAARAQCSKIDAGFHIQANALLAILESLIDPSREWLIPLSVQQKEHSPGSVIVVSKPYPRRNLTFRETNCIYYNQVLDDILSTGVSEDVTVDDNSNSCMNLFTCGRHRLLVQSRIDCRHPATEETFSVNSKTEFQPFVGFEQFSLKDLCQFWWSSKLANTTLILCARIDPRNNNIRRVDSYTKDVLCSPGCPYRPEIFISHLSSLLNVLYACPTGNYLLEHASGNNHIFLFEKKEKGFTTLETKYKDLLTGKRLLINEDPTNVPQWLPLDMNIRPEHFNDEEIPWLFDVPRSNIEFHALGKKTQQNTKQKGKKKQNIAKRNRNLHQKPSFFEPFLPRKQSKPARTQKFQRSIYTEPPPPGMEPPPPGVESPPPGIEPPSPCVEPPPPGIEHPKPGMELFPPGMEPPPPGEEPPAPGTEPPPPGVDVPSPTFNKIPVHYDDYDFGDL